MEIWTPKHYPEPSPPALQRALLRREYLKTLRSEASYSGRIVVPGDAQFPGYDGWLKDILCMRLPTRLPGAWGFGQRGFGIQPDMAGGLPTDAAAYWKMENANDSSSGAHTLTNTGTVTFGTPGKLVNAAQLNGSSQNLELPDTGDINLHSTSFTWLTWIFPTSVTSVHGMLYKGHGDSIITNQDYHLQINGAIARFFTSDGASQTNVDSSGSATINAWNFVVVTFSGTTAIIYMNNDAGNTNTSMSVPQHTAGQLFIGREGRDSFPNWFAGAIDTTALYRRVLTSTELAGFWNGGAGADAF